MTVVITTEHGNFEGETLHDATREAKRAAKRAARQEIENGVKRGLARTRAEATAYDILRFFVEGRLLQLGWRYYPTGHKYGPDVKVDYSCFDGKQRGFEIRVDTEYGPYTDYFSGYECLGHLWNGSGHTIAIFLKSTVSDDRYAIVPGVNDGVCSHCELPRLGPEDFKHGKDDAS